MKKFTFLALIAALVLTGCEQPVVIPEDLHSFDGIWGLSQDKEPAAGGQYSEYIRFNQQNTFEYFFLSDATYTYHRGTYKINQGNVTFTYKGLWRFDVVEKIARYTNDYYVEDSPDQAAFTIAELGSDRMTFKTANKQRVYFYKVEAVKGWNEEFSAPELEVTEANLARQWDQLDFFQAVVGGTTWWYFYEPEKQGITLLADGAMGQCPFWESRILENRLAAGTMLTDERVAVNPEDCSWSLSKDSVFMTCTKYVAYKTDANGNRTDERTVTPQEPVRIKFVVQVLTDYYCILYNTETQLFHAFGKHTEKASSAPIRRQNESFGTFSEKRFANSKNFDYICGLFEN